MSINLAQYKNESLKPNNEKICIQYQAIFKLSEQSAIRIKFFVMPMILTYFLKQKNYFSQLPNNISTQNFYFIQIQLNLGANNTFGQSKSILFITNNYMNALSTNQANIKIKNNTTQLERYLKMLRSLQPIINLGIYKDASLPNNSKKSLNISKIKKLKAMSLQEQKYSNMQSRKMSANSLKKSLAFGCHQNIQEMSCRSKSTDITNSKGILSIRLPKIESKTNNFSKFSSQIRVLKTEPSKQHIILPKLFFSKAQGAINGNLMQFVRKKPTQKYFSQLQNIRLAQKLLLAQPSRNLKKSQHNKFWQQQKTYRSKISRSTLMNKIISDKLRYKKHKKVQSMWVN